MSLDTSQQAITDCLAYVKREYPPITDCGCEWGCSVCAGDVDENLFLIDVPFNSPAGKELQKYGGAQYEDKVVVRARDLFGDIEDDFRKINAFTHLLAGEYRIESEYDTYQCAIYDIWSEAQK